MFSITGITNNSSEKVVESSVIVNGKIYTMVTISLLIEVLSPVNYEIHQECVSTSRFPSLVAEHW